MGRTSWKYVCFAKLAAKYCFIVLFFSFFLLCLQCPLRDLKWSLSPHQFSSFFLLEDTGTPLPHPSSCCNRSHDPFALFFFLTIPAQPWEQHLLVSCSIANLAKYTGGQQCKPYNLFSIHWWYCTRCLRNSFGPCFPVILHFQQPWECHLSQKQRKTIKKLHSWDLDGVL